MVLPMNILNLEPISLTKPHTREVTRTTQIVIEIQDDTEPDTTESTTIITEKHLSPPQPPSPPQETTIQTKNTSLEPMQLDPADLPEHVL
jgi:hypothetical protein